MAKISFRLRMRTRRWLAFGRSVQETPSHCEGDCTNVFRTRFRHGYALRQAPLLF